MEKGRRVYRHFRTRVNIRSVNTMIAYMASLMLAGVPPVVCETVLDEMVYSIKKTIRIND